MHRTFCRPAHTEIFATAVGAVSDCRTQKRAVDPRRNKLGLLLFLPATLRLAAATQQRRKRAHQVHKASCGNRVLLLWPLGGGGLCSQLPRPKSSTFSVRAKVLRTLPSSHLIVDAELSRVEQESQHEQVGCRAVLEVNQVETRSVLRASELSVGHHSRAHDLKGRTNLSQKQCYRSK